MRRREPARRVAYPVADRCRNDERYLTSSPMVRFSPLFIFGRSIHAREGAVEPNQTPTPHSNRSASVILQSHLVRPAGSEATRSVVCDAASPFDAAVANGVITSEHGFIAERSAPARYAVAAGSAAGSCSAAVLTEGTPSNAGSVAAGAGAVVAVTSSRGEYTPWLSAAVITALTAD